MTNVASICLILLLNYGGLMAYVSSHPQSHQGAKSAKKISKNVIAKIVVAQSVKIKSRKAARTEKPIPEPSAFTESFEQDYVGIEGEFGQDTSAEGEANEEYQLACGFIPIEKEPYIDLKKLQKKVIYPDLAKRAGIEGIVHIRILVDKNGVPKRHLIESSDSELFNEAAVRAVRSSVFTPALYNNQPIDCWISIPIVFRLR